MQRTENSQVILEEENEMKGLALVGVKSCYEAIIIERVWYWHKGRQTNRKTSERKWRVQNKIYTCMDTSLLEKLTLLNRRERN